jgi:magnesium transporter
LLQFYEVTGTTAQRSLICQDHCWIDVARPSNDELLQLREQFGIPKTFLRDALDPDERPRYVRSGEHLMFVIQASHDLGSVSATPHDTVPLAVILSSDHVFTVCEHRHTVLLEIKQGRTPAIATTQGMPFALELFKRVAEGYLSDLRAIDRRLDGLEARLERSTRNREILDLMRVEKSLVYFKTALKSNALMLERLRRDRQLELEIADQELLEDVIVEHRQASEMTDIALGIVGSMMGAFGSVISNNANAVVHRLTVATVMIAVPTWITGVFGMNVVIPFESQPWAFGTVIVLCLLAVLGTLALFRWRGWL